MKSNVIYIAFFCVLLLGCSVDEQKLIPEIQEPTYDYTIVAYGDSLTEGLGVERNNSYPAQLERALHSLGYNIKVHNSGLSGETSSGALARVDWVLRLDPDIVILGIGANDAIRGIDLDLTEQNIRNIIQKLKENNVDVILAGQIIFDNLGSEYVAQFEEMYPIIEQEEDVSFIPVFLEGVAGNSTLNNRDQIHPNKEGYEIVVSRNVLPLVLDVLD